jgi:hypothetical protein
MFVPAQAPLRLLLRDLSKDQTRIFARAISSTGAYGQLTRRRQPRLLRQRVFYTLDFAIFVPHS